MSAIRKFRLATATARLIARGRPGESHAEGYLPETGERRSFVHVAGPKCIATHVTTDGEEEYEIPLGHGRALLEICADQRRVLFYERIPIEIPGTTSAHVDRVKKPYPIDLLTLAFSDADAALAYRLPGFVGSEVSNDPEFDNRAIATNATNPGPGPTEVSNDGLNALLDLLEGRLTIEGERPSGPHRLKVFENSKPPQNDFERALGLPDTASA